MRGLSVDVMLQNVKLLIASPSVMENNDVIIKAKSIGIEVISELELGYRNCDSDIIAITGTNGKTTTTLLIQKLLIESGIDARAVGNIGAGFCSELLSMTKSSVAVLEASSFQLSAVELFSPKISICLNISPDHIEYHKTMENYISSKANILRKQTFNDYTILNFDDVIVREMSDKSCGNILYYSTRNKVVGVFALNEIIYYNDGENVELVMKVADVKMIGEHNLSNALAVIVVAKILNIPSVIIRQVLKEFSPPDFRIQHIGTYEKVKYFNDSKSTNIDSTITAVRAMNGQTVLIVGGYDKGLCYVKMFDAMPSNIITIIAYGANKEKVINDAKNNNTIEKILANDLSSAVNLASKIKCDNVLFSPATSSYDMFDNYVQRGLFFNEAVSCYFGTKSDDTYGEVVK